MKQSEQKYETFLPSGVAVDTRRQPSSTKHVNHEGAVAKHNGQVESPSGAVAPSYDHQCYICDKTFSANSNLNRHLRKIHKENVQSPYNNVRCALCESLYSSSCMYIDHLERDHKIEIVVEKIKFKTCEAFYEWKHSIENATTSQFIKSRGQKRTKNVNKTYYSCNRSGYYVSKARTQKALKKQGSRKINGRCPASMNVTSNSDLSCDVKFIKTHVGHDFELKHLDISEKDRDLIVRKLASGVTKKDIIRQIRSTAELHQTDAFSILPTTSALPGLGEGSSLCGANIQPIVINTRSSVPGCSEQQIEVVVPSASCDTTSTQSTCLISGSNAHTSKDETLDSDQSSAQTSTPTRDQTSPTPKSRLHLATTKDIHNILNSKHLDSKKIRHNYDLHAIEAWISEMKGYKDQSTVLFYKDQGDISDEFPKLRQEDFMLALMKEGQAEVFQKFGHKCVVIDSTHSIHCEYLHVTYLSVIDENLRGFPVAFLFSSRTDQDVMEAFFSLLKARTGPIVTRTFIADDLDDFYRAWEKTMSTPEYNLLTPWSVFDSWSRKFKLIKSREKLRRIKKQFKALINETELGKFNASLHQIISDLKRDADTSEFIAAFENEFAKDPDAWSSCNRKNLDISNYQLWNMHDKFKTIYKEGKHSKKMCKYASSLMKMFDEYQLNKLIQIEEANKEDRRANIEKRHKKGIETGSIVYEVAVDPAYWLCPSECSTDVYDEVRQSDSLKRKTTNLSEGYKGDSLVKRGKECCDSLCPKCQSCRHEYRCTCLDYIFNLNMCKHIHRISALCRQA